MTAVSLGSNTGGGTPPSKAEEFKLALVALGDGWLVGDGGGDQPEPRNNGAAVRITAELTCPLEVRVICFWD